MSWDWISEWLRALSEQTAVPAWLAAFGLTQMVEMGIYLAAFESSRPLRERVAIAFGASAITHPLVWFVIPPALMVDPLSMPWGSMVWCAEGFAVVVEALWLFAFGVGVGQASRTRSRIWRPIVRAAVPLAWSLAANTVSYSIGMFCYERLHWLS